MYGNVQKSKKKSNYNKNKKNRGCGEERRQNEDSNFLFLSTLLFSLPLYLAPHFSVKKPQTMTMTMVSPQKFKERGNEFSSFISNVFWLSCYIEE